MSINTSIYVMNILLLNFMHEIRSCIQKWFFPIEKFSLMWLFNEYIDLVDIPDLN